MTPARRLLGYVLRYRRSFLLGLVCVFATAAVGLAGPWVLKYAVDDLILAVDAGRIRFYAMALLALAASGGIAEPLLLALSALLPRLDLLGRGEWLIYGADIDGATALAFAQALVYVPLLLAAAAIDLARREF